MRNSTGKHLGMIVSLAALVSSSGTAQQATATGLEFGVGVNWLALGGSQWDVDGGPGLDLMIGYRWMPDVVVRGVFGATLAGDGQLVAPDVFRSEPVIGSTRRVALPHAAAELLFQPRAKRGIVDPSLGLRLGFTGRHSGAFGLGARAGPRFRVGSAVAIEAGAIGDLVYFVSRDRTPTGVRGGLYVMVIALQREP